MHIICLTPLEEGVYNDHASDNITFPPDGWAYIPDDMEKPSTFPRLGSLEAEMLTYNATDENGEGYAYTMMTVTKMTEGTLPEPVPEPDPAPAGDDSIWEELDKAYQEGVDSV